MEMGKDTERQRSDKAEKHVSHALDDVGCIHALVYAVPHTPVKQMVRTEAGDHCVFCPLLDV